MKLTRCFVALALNLSFIAPALFFVLSPTVSAQNSNGAMHRGYRTGYSDGYMAGYRDSIDSLAKEISRHREYEAADRAFNKEYGSLEDYRDGYRQGFQSGYETGFDKKTFESSVPAGLGRRGLNTPPPVIEKAVRETAPRQTSTTTSNENEPPISTTNQEAASSDNVTSADSDRSEIDKQKVIQKASFRMDDGSLMISKDTEIMIELQEEVSTESMRQGERFTAKVIGPMELDGAMVEGHIEKIQIPGRIRRTAELQLTFDRIVLSDGRWANFNGILTDITAIKGDNVRRITDEGTAIGQNSIKGDALKIGGATGAGAGVGAMVGGPVGAAVGAGIGAALGIGAAVTDRGKHIRLNANQQLRVRSTYDTRIR